MARSDIHRPSQIIPADYEFVGFRYIKIEDIGDAAFLRSERERINRHMEKTGAKMSSHAHGGNCHVCGAHCIYNALFYHVPSNVYICTGLDCAENLECGDIELFRRQVREALERQKGKGKAKAELERRGLGDAWVIYQASTDKCGMAEATMCDMIGKLVRYGSLTDKQYAFIGKLAFQVRNAEKIAQERAAAHALASDIPADYNGKRVTVRGKVLSVRIADAFSADFNSKMLIQHVDGWKLWGSLPASIKPEDARGNTIEFDALITISDKDSKYGFFSRPTKSKLV